MEHVLRSLWDQVVDALMGGGAFNMLQWTIKPPLACFVVQDGPIVHPMWHMEERYRHSFEDCERSVLESKFFLF